MPPDKRAGATLPAAAHRGGTEKDFSMSRNGFRFVHAACLCLDEPLVGTGTLAADDRDLVVDATFHAWEKIVQTCVAAQVEFLILAGNSFNARTSSLRARVALEKGFEQLAAHEISVFIAPGHLDPASAWRKHFQLPPHVTLIASEDHDPVAILREQRVIASLAVIASPDSDESRWKESGPASLNSLQTPFQIGVVPAGTPIRWNGAQPVPLDQPGVSAAACLLVKAAIDAHVDYIALGEGQPRTEHFAGGIIHDPGPAQSLSRQVAGPRGCSIVSVTAAGDVAIDAVAAAPVRWESIPLTVDRHCNWNDLAERMALLLMERAEDEGEQLWIVDWRLSGGGSVFDSLADPSRQRELWELLDAEMAGEARGRRIHRLERVGERPTSGPISNPATGAPRAAAGLMIEVDKLLEESGDLLENQTRSALLDLDWLQPAETRGLRDALQQIPRRRVIERARELAARWLD